MRSTERKFLRRIGVEKDEFGGLPEITAHKYLKILSLVYGKKIKYLKRDILEYVLSLEDETVNKQAKRFF